MILKINTIMKSINKKRDEECREIIKLSNNERIKNN